MKFNNFLNMGEEMCFPCKNNHNICDKVGNFSSETGPHQEFLKQINNKRNKEEEKDINLDTTNKIVYDNPLSNISLNESMNLGTCYIGTSKNNMKLKTYKPEPKLKTFMIKNKIALDDFNDRAYKFKESPSNKRLNLTARNENQKVIKYKNLINNNYYLENKIKIPSKYNCKNVPQKENIISNNENKNIEKKDNDNKNKDNKRDEIMNYFINKFINNTNIYQNNINNFLNKKNYIVDNKIYNNNSTSLLKDSNNSVVNQHNIYLKSNNDNSTSYINNSNNNNKITLNSEKDLNQIEKNLRLLYFKYNSKKLYKIFAKMTKNKKKYNKTIKQYDEINENFLLNNNFVNGTEYDVNLMPERKYLFIGQKINNKKNGYGLEIFKKSNAYYFGRFINNRRFGIGKYVINNVNEKYIYKGEISDIYAKGYGIYLNNETGDKYEGEWNNSMKNGIGIELYNTNFYQGTFVNGKRNGIGEYFWENNIFYYGEWKNNLMHGIGIYNFNDDSIYEGQWKNNKRDGFGILNINDDKIYAGFFENDCKNGFGVMVWNTDKKAFVGFWKNNKINGFGKMYYHEKAIYGQWKNGTIINKIEDIKELQTIFKGINKFFVSLLQLNKYEEVDQIINKYLSF